MLADLAQTKQMKSVSLRYFNAAGADGDCEIGEDHQPETHIIPLALDACFKKERPLTVFGTDYATPDGTCVRDYIHVSDLARAHVLAVESIESHDKYWRAYNLGTGRGASVLEIIKAVERISKQKANIKMGARRPGDPPALVASPGLAGKELGWSPEYSSLDNIIKTAFAWYKKHHIE
jgi:UDP-glucose 4-epimerase